MNFELSFLYALFLATARQGLQGMDCKAWTARQGLLIVELLDFHWRKLFVSLVVCL